MTQIAEIWRQFFLMKFSVFFSFFQFPRDVFAEGKVPMCGNARATNELNGREVFKYTVVEGDAVLPPDETSPACCSHHQQQIVQQQQQRKPTPTKSLITSTKPLVTRKQPTCNDGFPEENSLPEETTNDVKPTHFVPPGDEKPTCAPPQMTTRPATKIKSTLPPPHCKTPTSAAAPVRTRPTHPTFGSTDVSKTRPTHPAFIGCPEDDVEDEQKPTKAPKKSKPSNSPSKSPPTHPTESPSKKPTKLPPTKPNTTPFTGDSEIQLPKPPTVEAFEQNPNDADIPPPTHKPMTLKNTPPSDGSEKPTEKQGKKQPTEKSKGPILESPLPTQEPKVSKKPKITSTDPKLVETPAPQNEHPIEKPKPEETTLKEEEKHVPPKTPLGPILESPLPTGEPLEIKDPPPPVTTSQVELEKPKIVEGLDGIKADKEPTEPDEKVNDPAPSENPEVSGKLESSGSPVPTGKVKTSGYPPSSELSPEKKRMMMLKMLKTPIYSNPD